MHEERIVKRGRWTETSLFSLAIIRDTGCQTEVSDFDPEVCIKEEISELKVSVDHCVGVHVLRCIENLGEVVSNFRLCKYSPPLVQLHHRLRDPKPIRQYTRAHTSFGDHRSHSPTPRMCDPKSQFCQWPNSRLNSPDTYESHGVREKSDP